MAEHRSVVTPLQFVVAAHVASIVMVVALMTGACAFVIIVCEQFVGLIAWVCTVFLI